MVSNVYLQSVLAGSGDVPVDSRDGASRSHSVQTVYGKCAKKSKSRALLSQRVESLRQRQRSLDLSTKLCYTICTKSIGVAEYEERLDGEYKVLT